MRNFQGTRAEAAFITLRNIGFNHSLTVLLRNLMCTAIPLHHMIVTIKAKNSVSQLQVKLNPELLLLIRVTQSGKSEVTKHHRKPVQSRAALCGPGHQFLTEATPSPKTCADRHAKELQGQQMRQEQTPGKLHTLILKLFSFLLFDAVNNFPCWEVHILKYFLYQKKFLSSSNTGIDVCIAGSSEQTLKLVILCDLAQDAKSMLPTRPRSTS